MNRLSPKKHGTVKIYIRPVIDNRPWLRKLGGRRTTRDLLRAVRRSLAKRLHKRIKEIHYEPYADGWIFLCDNFRIIWNTKQRGRWDLGEERLIAPHQLHEDNRQYDE